MIQDDARERELISLFGLKRDPAAGRSDTDALMEYKSESIPFELKSTTSGSITTVRDFGPEHIRKWKNKHWLIGVYDKKATLRYCLYGSPADMKPWIEEKRKYIQPDFELARHIPDLITLEIMYAILGMKDVYTLEDAKNIQKKQFTTIQYKKLMDVGTGYSSQRMLKILKARCKYVIERGSTLNNPHIPESYFESWPKIEPGDTKALLSLVSKYFASKQSRGRGTN
jgi:hypothetical protein